MFNLASFIIISLYFAGCASTKTGTELKFPPASTNSKVSSQKLQIINYSHKIKVILKSNIQHFKRCYSAENSSKKIDGVTQLNFIVGASGIATKVRAVSKSILPPGIKRCVVKVFNNIRFPAFPGRGTIKIRQPFRFP